MSEIKKKISDLEKREKALRDEREQIFREIENLEQELRNQKQQPKFSPTRKRIKELFLDKKEPIFDVEGFEYEGLHEFEDCLELELSGWKINYVEGSGYIDNDEYWLVISCSKGDEIKYFKFEGSYYSYGGTEIDDVLEVRQKEKTIKVWE